MKSPFGKAYPQGFTLIELLAVITIVAVLSAIAFVMVPQISQKAKTSRCLSNMRQAGMAFRLYAGDNKGSLPTQKTDGLTVYDTAGWVGQLRPYIQDFRVVLCPESNATDRSASYLYNSFVSTYSQPARSAVKINESGNPAGDILLLDSMSNYTVPGFGSYIVTTVENTSLPWRYPHPSEGLRNGAQSVLFMDGHVQLSPIGTLNWRQLQWPQ